jgi:hypothetical protein
MIQSFSLEYPDFGIQGVIPVNARPNLWTTPTYRRWDRRWGNPC